MVAGRGSKDADFFLLFSLVGPYCNVATESGMETKGETRCVQYNNNTYPVYSRTRRAVTRLVHTKSYSCGLLLAISCCTSLPQRSRTPETHTQYARRMPSPLLCTHDLEVVFSPVFVCLRDGSATVKETHARAS